MTESSLFEFVRKNQLLFLFAALAIVVRLIFWVYTGRVWEDALISMVPARNVWEGFGLTHHSSEPHVQSFTSALGELILIAGEFFGAGYGLVAMRLASLAASLAAIYFAYRCGQLLGFNWAAQCLVLGYLAADHLQVFFGMAGMETQVATALILANIYFYLTRHWGALGLVCGAAFICRPEFAAWVGIVSLSMIVFYREGLVRFVLGAVIISAPWLIFAHFYYGSVVPHTIVVKSSFSAMSKNPAELWEYGRNWWANIAPFRQFWVVENTPVPDLVLMFVVATLAALAAGGAVRSTIHFRPMMAVVVLVLVFFSYRTLYRINPYFMWYLPPFTAVFFLLAAYGVSAVSRFSKTAAAVISVTLVFSYAAPLIFTMPLDRAVEIQIEEGVRKKVGMRLNELMKPNDSVFLEPLGFIGWEIRNRTTYDYPGLSSPVAFNAFRRTKHMSGVIEELRPDLLVLRPHELDEFMKDPSSISDDYEVVEIVKADPFPDLYWGGLQYYVIDQEFTILRKKEAL